jgi:hypothetical protein
VHGFADTVSRGACQPSVPGQVYTGPGTSQTPVSTYEFKFDPSVLPFSLVATNAHFHNVTAKRGNESNHTQAVWNLISQQMLKHKSHLVCGDFNQACGKVQGMLAAKGSFRVVQVAMVHRFRTEVFTP